MNRRPGGWNAERPVHENALPVCPSALGKQISIMNRSTHQGDAATKRFTMTILKLRNAAKEYIMKTLILTAAAVALSFSFTSEAEAKGPVSGGGRSMSSHGSHGSFRYHGHHAYRHGHNFWNQRRWFSNYGCYGYYCPTRTCWYYQYQQGNCYLPMSCYQTYAPTVVPNAAPIANLPPNLPPVTPNLPPVQPVKPIKPVKPV